MYKPLDFDQMTPVNMRMMVFDALVNLLDMFIHTSSLIRENYPNAVPVNSFTNLNILRLEIKAVSRHFQECVVFLSPIILNSKFHSF